MCRFCVKRALHIKRRHTIINRMKEITNQRRRQVVFCFDTLSLCFGMAKVCSGRLRRSLHDIEEKNRNGVEFEDLLDSAFLDAWSIVDLCHRIRRVLKSVPGIKQSETWLQSFVRSTAGVEEARNHVQHLDSGLPQLPEKWTPVMGTLSWASFLDPMSCWTTMLGSLEDGITNNSVSFDTIKGEFTQDVELTVGERRIPLLAICDRIEKVQGHLVDWVKRQPHWQSSKRRTPLFRMTIEPRLSVASTDGSEAPEL